MNPAAFLPLLGGAILAALTVWQFRRGAFALGGRRHPRSEAGFWLGLGFYAAFALFLLGYGVSLLMTAYQS